MQGGNPFGEPGVSVVERVEVLGLGGEVLVAVGVEHHGQVVGRCPLVDLHQAIREGLERLLVARLDTVELRQGGGELVGQLPRTVGGALDLRGQLHFPGAGLARPLLEVGDLRGLLIHPLLELVGIGLGRVDSGAERGIRGSREAAAGDHGDGENRKRHYGEAASPVARLSPHPRAGPPIPRL